MTLARLRKSIEKHGQLQPVVVDRRTGVIIDGVKRELAVGLENLRVVEVETKSDAEAVELVLESMSPSLRGKEKRAWVLKKFEVLTRLGLPKARAVELLSQYSGYHKEHIRKIVKSAFAEKGAQNELISEKQPIKIEPEIAAKVKQLPIQDCWKEVEPNSVDLILTDPPYAYDYLDVWDYLSSFAAYALKPGKLLIAYSGKAYLPVIYERLNKHLDYIWTIALIHTGNKRKWYPKLNIFERWKPLLVFAKPTYQAIEPFEDIIFGTGREKEFHEHEQAVGEAELIISRFTKENDLVVDPFCGSGTVLVAAKKLGRRFYGFDVDENAIKTTLERLQNAA